jgi:hypothetical protein
MYPDDCCIYEFIQEKFPGMNVHSDYFVGSNIENIDNIFQFNFSSIQKCPTKNVISFSNIVSFHMGGDVRRNFPNLVRLLSRISKKLMIYHSPHFPPRLCFIDEPPQGNLQIFLK